MGGNAVRIVPLADRRDLIPQVAHLLEATWPEYYGDEGPGFALRDAAERASDELPVALVAVDERGAVVGSGTLAGPSYGAEAGETPWIIGLCVAPERRNQGIASELVSSLCQQAIQRGCSAIYATTISAVALLVRAGFHPLRRLTDEKGVWVVMRRALK